ncbi:MAG: hypothetical protein A2712_02320 [Deltaproteobacteria bacterium RIFCSPHIGHO2_01_FULL_43_49]|nr:MAG: hypothetical protein A2712_02320 [Deltaproteobacteria bacterium RIFCSPHIGHO2_01_FULL_43_49]OGQ27341.1 MAG: hypothetical protein A3D98_02915 [Deltaproteobacteria bacterium RIFCSPHIGHO2_12_FULL_44_21]
MMGLLVLCITLFFVLSLRWIPSYWIPSYTLSFCLVPSYFVVFGPANEKSYYLLSLVCLGIWWVIHIVHHRFFKILRLESFKLILVFCIALTAIILPLSKKMMERTSGNYGWVHDGIIHTEYALKLLTEGRNIYQEDVPDGVFPPLYTHISYQTGSGKMIYPKNHSFYHYPYPPLYLLQSFPFYFVLQRTVHWFDQRLILLFYFFGTAYWLAKKTPFSINVKYTAFFLLFLNPYFLGFFLEGRNDLVVFFWVFLCFLFLYQRKTKQAIWALTIATLLKQITLPLVPFVFLYLYFLWRPITLSSYFKRVFGESFPPLLFGFIVMAPFAVWNFNGLWTDMVLNPAGKLATSQPIGGYSFLAFLIRFGLLEDPLKYYPTAWIQLPLYGTLFILSYFKLRDFPNVGTLIILTSFALFLFLFFSRFCNQNYLEFTAKIFLLGWLFKRMQSQNDLFAPKIKHSFQRFS